MSDHEPSYYEIALTNRQVVVAFVILLVCLMGSFVAGVWIGRGDTGDGERTTVARAELDEAGARPLDFFSGGELEGEPAGESAGESAGEGTRTPPTAAPQTAPPPVEDPADARARRQAERRQREESEAAAGGLAGGEGAALGPRAPQAGPPPDAGSGTGAAEGPVIQVFSSNDRGQAERVVNRLTGGGERAFLSPVDVDGQTMYRVRIGPFGDRGEAEKVADRVRRQYRYDTWITQ